MLNMSHKPFFGSPALGRVLADLRLTCLDVGARGGFTKELLPLASSIDACGFEPDAEECTRLNQAAADGSHPWHTLRFVPTALGRAHETRTLNLYRKRGCSSLLEADVALADSFSRGEYYILDGTLEVPTMQLDAAVQKYDLANAVYMKIDIQGAEREVFASAPQLLRQQMLVIRTEVSFIPIYYNQPLFSDINAQLREYGFVPIGFVELHHWRRTTRRKHPQLAEGPIPYSRGQMVHGDMVYFRDPALMPDETPQEIEQLLKAAFLAITYEYVDHAAAMLSRPAVARHLQSRYDCDWQQALSAVSRTLARQHRQAEWARRWRETKRLFRFLKFLDFA
jgi:FkbM family methyltransferase